MNGRTNFLSISAAAMIGAAGFTAPASADLSFGLSLNLGFNDWCEPAFSYPVYSYAPYSWDYGTSRYWRYDPILGYWRWYSYDPDCVTYAPLGYGYSSGYTWNYPYYYPSSWNVGYYGGGWSISFGSGWGWGGWGWGGWNHWGHHHHHHHHGHHHHWDHGSHWNSHGAAHLYQPTPVMHDHPFSPGGHTQPLLYRNEASKPAVAPAAQDQKAPQAFGHGDVNAAQAKPAVVNESKPLSRNFDRFETKKPVSREAKSPALPTAVAKPVEAKPIEVKPVAAKPALVEAKPQPVARPSRTGMDSVQTQAALNRIRTGRNLPTAQAAPLTKPAPRAAQPLEGKPVAPVAAQPIEGKPVEQARPSNGRQPAVKAPAPVAVKAPAVAAKPAVHAPQAHPWAQAPVQDIQPRSAPTWSGRQGFVKPAEAPNAKPAQQFRAPAPQVRTGAPVVSKPAPAAARVEVPRVQPQAKPMSAPAPMVRQAAPTVRQAPPTVRQAAPSVRQSAPAPAAKAPAQQGGGGGKRGR